MTLARRDFLVSATALTAAACCGTTHAAPDDASAKRRAALEKHRITAITPLSVQMKWPRLVGKNSRLDVHGRGPRVRVCAIETDGPSGGWGAVRGNEEALQQAAQQAKGKTVAELFDPAVGILDPQLAPLDFALHDLAGQILDLPVYEMLGAAGPKESPCYSGMIYFDDLEPADRPAGIEKVIQNCRDDFQRGYRQLKVKIGRGNKWMPKAEGLQRDIEVTRAIAEALPEATILVDGNDGFTVEDMIAYLEGIGDVKLYWIEEPFRESVEGFRRLRQWLTEHDRNTLLADGEASPDWNVLNQLAEQQLLDVQLVDIVGYGFTAWRKLMPLLQQQKVAASPHAWGDILKTYYTSHLAAGLGNVATIEGVTCECDQIDFGDYRLADGQLRVSDAPGFGMKLRV